MLHPGAAVTLIPNRIHRSASHRRLLPSCWHANSRLFSVAYANRSENGDHAVMHSSRYARWIRSTACRYGMPGGLFPNLTNNTPNSIPNPDRVALVLVHRSHRWQISNLPRCRRDEPPPPIAGPASSVDQLKQSHYHCLGSNSI